MGVIIPFALRSRSAVTPFEAIGEAHHAKMLMFPAVQVRDIQNIWGMTVEGPPLNVPEGVAFGDSEPLCARSSDKASGAKTPGTKSTKRKPAQRAPK